MPPKAADKPTLIVANTIKGKGISFAENNVKWHHHAPNDEELRTALQELTEKIKALHLSDQASLEGLVNRK